MHREITKCQKCKLVKDLIVDQNIKICHNCWTKIKKNKMKELKIKLANGNVIVCGEGKKYQWGKYIILRDKKGKELLYYDIQEWIDNPELVIGAFMKKCSEK